MTLLATTWPLDPQTLVRPLTAEDAVAVHQLIANNHPHLDRWLRWSAAIQTLDDVRELIEQFEQKRAQGDGFHGGIWQDGRVVGGVICWYINRQHRNAEVGYWLGAAATGRGLATRATRAVMTSLFTDAHLHRVELQCGVDNYRSRAVAERLGFRLEGVRRQSHWITNRFADHAIYGVLAEEWTC